MFQELRFGIITLPNVPWTTLVERWRYLEALGFDSVWNIDHFVNPYQPSQAWFESWTLLAALATQTTHIRIGVMVTSITFRNPALLVKQILTIDHISQGRLNVGIGAGGKLIDYSMPGIGPWGVSERVGRFREVIEIVDHMLCNEVTTYQGRYYRVNDAIKNPASVQLPRPPLTIAAHIPASLELASMYADTWISYGGHDLSPQRALAITHQRNELLDEYCITQGRDPREINRSFLAGFTLDMPFASVDAFHDFVGRYREVGINEFIFYYPADEFYHAPKTNQMSIFERVAKEVIPTMQVARKQ